MQGREGCGLRGRRGGEHGCKSSSGEMSRWPTRLLDGADVVTALEEVGGEGVAEGVAARALVDPRLPDGAGHGALDVGLVVMMATLGAVTLPAGRRGKYPLPAPVARRRRELRSMASGNQNAPESGGEVFLVQVYATGWRSQSHKARCDVSPSIHAIRKRRRCLRTPN